MGTDGLWDNLFDNDIISLLETKLNGRQSLNVKQLQELSESLSTFAEIKSYDAKYESPFTIEARNAKKEKPGGKKDDITVIVAQIIEEEME
jgi:protein phosphatase PTC7